MQWHPLAGVFLKHRPMHGHGLLQTTCVALPFAYRLQDAPKVALNHRPIQRHSIPRKFLKRRPIGSHGFLRTRNAGFPLA